MGKASGDNGIPVEIFQILKDDSVKVLHPICQQIQKTQQWPQGWKKSVFIPIPKRGSAKECSNTCTPFTCQQVNAQNYPSQDSTVHEPRLPDVQAVFRDSKGTRNQIANINWIIKKAGEFEKNIYFCFIDYGKAFDYVHHNKLEKSLKRWEYEATFSAS